MPAPVIDCSTSQLYHRYLKPYITYRTGYSNSSLSVLENEFPSFPHSRNLKVQIVMLEFQINSIFIFGMFFSMSGSLKLKKIVGMFPLNLIVFKSHRTFLKLQEKHTQSQSECMEMAFKEIIFRIFEGVLLFSVVTTTSPGV